MILQRFGSYLLQKRSNAIWVVLLCSFLPFLQIPTLSIATIIVGLITLHKGTKEGLIIACWALLPGIAISFYVGFGVLLLEGLGKILIVWLLAAILGHTNRWSATLQIAALCGVIVVTILHLIAPDLSSWWQQRLGFLAAQLQNMGNLDLSLDELKTVIEKLSYFATGAAAAGVLAFDTILVLIARAWQAQLFNPGGLKQEWYQLRMNYLYAGITLAVIAGAWLEVAWFMDVLPVVLMPFLLAGLSLIHAILPEKSNVRIPVLIIVYVGLLFLSPYMSILLMLIAFIDSWFDFRKLRKRIMV